MLLDHQLNLLLRLHVGELTFMKTLVVIVEMIILVIMLVLLNLMLPLVFSQHLFYKLALAKPSNHFPCLLYFIPLNQFSRRRWTKNHD